MQCEHRKKELYRCSRCRPQNTYQEFLRGAKRRGLPVLLTQADYERVVSGNCKWCNDDGAMSVDRINSDIRQYTVANSQPLCVGCQRLKWNLSEAELASRIISILKHKPELAAAAGFILATAKPEAQPPQAPAVPADAVEPAATQPPREPPQRLADLARCIPTPPHSWDYLDPAARAFLEGHG